MSGLTSDAKSLVDHARVETQVCDSSLDACSVLFTVRISACLWSFLALETKIPGAPCVCSHLLLFFHVNFL